MSRFSLEMAADSRINRAPAVLLQRDFALKHFPRGE